MQKECSQCPRLKCVCLEGVNDFKKITFKNSELMTQKHGVVFDGPIFLKKETIEECPLNPRNCFNNDCNKKKEVIDQNQIDSKIHNIFKKEAQEACINPNIIFEHTNSNIENEKDKIEKILQDLLQMFGPQIIITEIATKIGLTSQSF